MSAFIDERRGDFGVELICDTLEISASAYYQRKTGVRSARAVEDERLVDVIKRTHAANYEAYGSRRMWKALRREGEDVGRGHVERLMAANGICGAKRRGKPWRTTIAGSDPIASPDLVNRDFTASAPNLMLRDIRDEDVRVTLVEDDRAARGRDWARAGPCSFAVLRAGEQAAVGDRRGEGERAAIDAGKPRAGGLMDRSDRVQQPADWVAARGRARKLPAQREQAACECCVGVCRAARAAQPAADGRGRDAGVTRERSVPCAAGGADERLSDGRDDIAAVGQQEARQQRVRALAAPAAAATHPQPCRGATVAYQARVGRPRRQPSLAARATRIRGQLRTHAAGEYSSDQLRLDGDDEHRS